MESRVDSANKRQILIYPTKLRLKFWLLYCKNKLNSEIKHKVDIARNKIIEYDNIENIKQKFNANTIKKEII